ncbi:MAG: AtzE family amidohydrolase, partial [Leptolyngbyaceae bacterium]|nr:AtzE family amidohydrolase [Leptolyngbyaceae bacterium]
TLDRIESHDTDLNCFTEVLAESALASAKAVDRAIADGTSPGPLAGVPFAVKNLLDIEGVTTLSGAKIEQDSPPAQQDATVITRLKEVGAVLIGALNMDEYAYGFVTENSHFGPTLNPHDRTRVAGGSSGGSAASVSAGLVPLTLGSDTNGSIRVPASFCGIFGLKPTYRRISRAGAFLFAASFDHIGPFARSVRDLAVAFDVLHGFDPQDPISSPRPISPVMPHLDNGLEGLRLAIADDHFDRGMEPVVRAGLEQVTKALGVTQTVTIPEAKRARAAAYIITASEGSNLHLANLKKRAQDFDPATRDRFLAGAMIPASWYAQAQRFRQWYRDRVLELFQDVDVILAPTTPCPATKVGQVMMTIDGVEVKARPNIGLFTQPLSFIGLPIVSVPVQQPGELPVGVQVIGAPYQEAKVLRVARVLEAQGVVSGAIALPPA